MYHALTEAVIIVHLAFLTFVIAGSLWARRCRWVIPFHIGALAWAVHAESSSGVVCPLTALENFFALRAGIAEYRSDFIAHYLVPVLYQEGLTPGWQFALTLTVVVLNLLAYLSLFFGQRKPNIMRVE